MKRKPYAVRARPAVWQNADGTASPLVKLFGGTRGSIAVDYSEIPSLIAQLENLHTEQLERDRYIDALFIEEDL